MADLTQWLNSESELREDSLFAYLYKELKIIAHSQMSGEKPGQTLNATALVHEAWLRIEKSSPEGWGNRRHFFGAASEAMRRILVEAARRRLSVKRGAGDAALSIDEIEISSPIADERILEVNEVLDKLEAENEVDAQIVKMRFFAGMNNHEIAALLGVNEKTVRRHWNVAKLWLFRELKK